MPVRNAGEYLTTAVDSILSQQDVLLELLIIDDHSSDGAIEKLEQDPRIRILQSPGTGIVPALNFGLQAARHPYIARMDGDDIALPQRLITQLQYLLDNPAIDIAGAQVEMFRDDADIREGYALYQDWINSLCHPQSIADAIFIESPIPHPTAFMRKSTLNSLGGYHDTAWPEDYDLWCRAHLAGLKFGKPENGILLRWRDHEIRASQQDERYAKQGFLRCKARYLSEFLKTQSISTCCIWGTGPTGLKLHDYLAEYGIRISGFIDVNAKLAGRQKRGKEIQLVRDAQDLTDLPNLCLVAVSARGARERHKIAVDRTTIPRRTGFYYGGLKWPSYSVIFKPFFPDRR